MRAAWIIAVTACALGTPALAAGPRTSISRLVPEPDPDEPESQEERGPEAPWRTQLGTRALYGTRGPGVDARLSIVAPTDSFLELDLRGFADGRAVTRVGGGLDVLGGGRAHLHLGGFAGVSASFPKDTLQLAPLGGGLVGLGYEDERLGLGWQVRLGLTDLGTAATWSEHEVHATWFLGERVGLTATWMRVRAGAASAEQIGGLGVRVGF